jgi:tetratricopeptide (TPR) repeat protein
VARALLTLLILATVIPARAQTAAPTRKAAASNFAALAAQAEQASQQDRLDDAVVLYRKALVLKSSWAEGWWSLGTIQYDRNNFKSAAVAFQHAAALDPKKGSPRVMLGLCEFELGQDDAALKHIEEGKQLGLNPDPQFQEVMLYHEGVLLSRKGRFNAAADIFSQLSKSGVQSEELTLALGMTSLQIQPKDLPAENTPGREVVRRAGQAEALVAAGKFDDAKEAYRRLVNHYPDYPDIQYASGRLLLKLGDVDDAVAAFQQELKNSPQSVPARLQIAAARYQSDSAAGLPYAQEAVKLAPQLPFAHYLDGLLLLDTGDFQQAIPHLEFAEKGLRSEPGVYFALGNAYAKAGRKQEAARARATFLQLKKTQKPGQNNSPNTYGDQPKLPSPDRATEAPPSSRPE